MEQCVRPPGAAGVLYDLFAGHISLDHVLAWVLRQINVRACCHAVHPPNLCARLLQGDVAQRAVFVADCTAVEFVYFVLNYIREESAVVFALSSDKKQVRAMLLANHAGLLGQCVPSIVYAHA